MNLEVLGDAKDVKYANITHFINLPLQVHHSFQVMVRISNEALNCHPKTF